jgi:hypothetical protein
METVKEILLGAFGIFVLLVTIYGAIDVWRQIKNMKD